MPAHTCIHVEKETETETEGQKREADREIWTGREKQTDTYIECHMEIVLSV